MITTIQQADQIIASPEPQWIFKYSATCPISHQARDEFEAYLRSHPDAPAHIVVIQSHRDISNHLAARLAIRHESPQFLLVQAGQTLWHASHFQCTAANMQQALADHAPSPTAR
jgi:bacillithiol system protein YtxJ